ncbi:MAG: sporulation protein YqfD [Clostridia bacterium]|nr:sporulation protein YqfD [Clostridia bacterium]
MGLRRWITVEGLNLSRFVRCAGECGAKLTELKRHGGRRLTAVVEDAALPRLQEIAENGGWQLTCGAPVGAGRLCGQLLKRWPLLMLVAVAVLLWAGAGQVMWRIALMDAGAYEADVWHALDEMGVNAPMLRRRVDPAALRDELEWRYPKVAWVECGWRGSTLEIRFVQGVEGREASDDGACDVVAARDGVVVNIVTRAGTPVVSPGDVVRAGDVLIRGVERTSGGLERLVAARGSVYARVWDSAAVQTPLTQLQSVSTGRIAESNTIVSPWFSLWKGGEHGFAHADTHRQEQSLGGFFWPLTVRYETHIETDLRSVNTDSWSVIDENNAAALQQLYAIAGGKESLVDNWVNWSIIEDEILLSIATGERVVDIARQERSSGMAAPE